MTFPTRALVLLLVLAVVLAACSGSAGGYTPPPASGQPSPAASSNPAGGGPVSTPEEAAQRVIDLDPRFAGIGPKNPDLIGGCCFYEATPTANGFDVNVELGWGDCPAGCISRHRWSYAVGTDGTTTLVSESGDPVPSGFPGGGGSTDY
jgi:hypothetical protein